MYQLFFKWHIVLSRILRGPNILSDDDGFNLPCSRQAMKKEKGGCARDIFKSCLRLHASLFNYCYLNIEGNYTYFLLAVSIQFFLEFVSYLIIVVPS